MKLRRVVTLVLLALVATVAWGVAPPAARAIDETKVPHYFGPYPNWALSPLPAKGANGAVLPGTGIRKFVDGLPGLGAAGANNLGQYLPVAVPDTTSYPGSDYYEIAVVQYRQKMHSDLPPTLLRGYVQLSTAKVPGAQVPLSNALVNGNSLPITGYTGVAAPNYLGPVILATKNRPVRILFRNLLPTGADGNLFLPVDSTFMGAGMAMMMESYDVTPATGGSYDDAVRNPVCSQSPKDPMCYTENREVVHLHGGTTPWISDGTPHQWITPAGETTDWKKGDAVMNVPDMPDPGPGATTLYYTNQQSARLMFYHDHAWGITRLNVYAGVAAGYAITDDTEKALVDSGAIPGPSDTIPLIIQDRTFVPTDDQILTSDPANGRYAQDPTWDKARWGGFGNLWYHHVYMPAQNPDDPSGMSAYGRWMYGPWFWPPANGVKYGPIKNPRYNMDPASSFTTPLAQPCNLDDPSTWQYQVDPFCEPELIPGTPNISAGMEQFNDTPIVNGTAYPTTTVDPKAYRLRILNAANDRFFNLQLYVADNRNASSALNGYGQPIGGTEVALKASEVAAAQDDPNVFPTPDTALSPAGPNWIQIASEGGFLPSPVVIPPRPITWITDPTRFDVGNVDQHSLALAPAERADVVVDFSQYAGQTLILYNDAPAAYPARVASYDYYTGAPDLSPNGAPGVLPGYGPNTRTIMQIKVREGSGTAFTTTALDNAFAHKTDNTGVFESGQHPIIVGQAAYNTAYGTSFPSASNCNAPGSTKTKCDGLARINQQGGDLFGFNTLANPTVKTQIPLEPKALHDEMNAATFDDYGRMTANIGVETVPSSAGAQSINLMPYIFPPTEIINATDLPRTDTMTQLGTAADGSQIWKITHNGVDTHPIHFHLYDVQLLNRVTWDNIIILPDANELGWKDTVRVSPLEDTIVALRPAIPTLPFDLPNSIRLLDPSRPDGAPIALASVMDTANLGLIPPSNPDGEPIDVYNHKVNFGAEYVWHCHILSHEEMDMMRPVAVALPPVAPANLALTLDDSSGTVGLTWRDKSLSETAFEVERAQSPAGPWTQLARLESVTGPTNTATIGYQDTPGGDTSSYLYRVRAINVVGDTWNYAAAGNEIVSGGFPTVTAVSPYSGSAAVPAPITGSVAINGGAASTGSLTVTLTLSASSASGAIAKMQFSKDNGTTWTSWENYATTRSVTLASGAGTLKSISVRFKDAKGNVSRAFSDTINLNVPPPTGSVVINGGAASTGSLTVTLTLSAHSGGSTVTQMQFSKDNGATWTGWENYATTRSVSLAATGNGVKSISVRYRDAIGGVSAVYSDTITLSAPLPTGSILINGGAASTGSPNVTLTLSASGPSTILQMQFSKDGGAWTPLETYATTRAVTLGSTTAGVKTVAVRYLDAAGNLSASYTASIQLTTPPPTGSILINGGAASTTSVTVTLTLSATGANPVTQMQFSKDGGAWTPLEAYATTRSVTLSTTGNGLKTVSVRYVDSTGSVSVPYSASITLNSPLPTGSILINGGAASTTSSTATLTLSATSASGAVISMQFSKDGGATWTLLEPYQTTRTVTLTPAGPGVKTVAVRYLDGAGNLSQSYQASIVLQ